MDPSRWLAILKRLLAALALALGGCAVPDRAPAPVAPPVHVPESTWLQVDSEIGAASRAATGLARDYAHGSMEDWRNRVRQRTESNFIPWFTDYWTQQWLSVKLGWYKLNAGDDREWAMKQLSAYLQGRYRDLVLRPVAREIDPNGVRKLATALYVQSLGEAIDGIPQRYGVPRDQFDRRLKAIPAIALPSPPAQQEASLYQVVNANPLARLPAYEALMEQMTRDAGSSGTGPGDGKVSPMGKWAGEQLGDRLAVGGGASAAAAVIGGLPGMMLSLVTTGLGAVAHENERPRMEAQLRENLEAAMDGLWHAVIEDPATGVMAGVYSISAKVEGRLPPIPTEPVELQPVPRRAPPSGQ